MFQAFRRTLVPVWLGVSLILLGGPLRAARVAPLGTLRSDGTALLDQDLVQRDATLYSGDHVKTLNGRATISFLNSGLMVLERQSHAAFRNSPEGVLVSLESGQVSLSFPASGPMCVETDGLAVTRVGSFPAVAEVALRADGSVLISVHQGKLAVENLRDKPVVMQAGQYIQIDPQLAQNDQQTQTVGTAAHGKKTLGEKLRTFHVGRLSHAASVGLVLAIGGGTAAAIAIPLSQEGQAASPHTP